MANSGGEYQVFLNFCGPDTRRGFTNSLYYALVDAGIRVFIDNKELPRGETFSSNLLQAIDHSKLYITIFSPNYASHHWCLRELAKMVENISKPEEDGNKKVILPIFYNVKPDDVKLKTDLYSKAILQLEQKMEDQKKKFRTEEVETWRQALKEVDAIQGWELEKYEGDGQLSKAVVEYVVNRLQIRQREVTKDLVGMDDRVEDINNILDIDSGGVRLIGIYGMGGIGKTTLVKKIYNQLCPYFGKNCSFLEDVRETAKTKGLMELQKQLLSDFSNSSNISNIDNGIKRIGDTIRNKKVLIVLDDVDDSNQIQKLIGVNSFYPGTTIFVTTRDKSVLKFREFQFEEYEMKGLSNEDALQLFSRHAFNDNFPQVDYYNLSKELVSTTGGLPLALQAIGASLFKNKDKEIWGEMLKKLRKPHLNVLGKLKITYDALEAAQQDIFLDIACFFINEKNTDPVFMWCDCGFSPKSDIDVLIKRCMIKVLDNDKFWMHDQFRDLGRAIAEEGQIRLWDTTNIIGKLRSREEKHSVQALCLRRKLLDMSSVTVTARRIKRFPHLRFLWLANVYVKGDFAGCLSELKWLYLSDSFISSKHLKFMPTNLHLQNVVVLRTQGYQWTNDAVNSLLKEAKKLKVLTIDVGHSKYGMKITFFESSVLEKLSIFNCPSLKISRSIGKLRQLTFLKFKRCNALEKLPEQIGELKDLQHLSLKDCMSFRELPDSFSKLESLTKLVALDLSITRLPRTMSKFTKLHTLDLRRSNEIQELPELPRSLTTLRLKSRSLRIVPDISNLTNLVELLLSDKSISNSEASIPHSNIIQPCDLPWIGGLSKLRKKELCLLNVRATSVEWGSFSLLEELRLCGLDLQTLTQLPSNLRVLQLRCTPVKQVELGELPNLEELIINSCERIVRISITSSLKKLRDVEVRYCNKLVEVQFLDILKSIKSISIWQCECFERLVCSSPQAPELTDGCRRVSLVSSSLKMLRKLELFECELQEIHFVSTLEALKEFFIYSCIPLTRLGGLSNLKNLNILRILWCENLQVVEGIDKLERLQELRISCCRSMERIIDASISKIPKDCRIKIDRCGQLLDTGSSITWERYKKMILDARTQASNSTIETTYSKTGDPLLEQQDDGGEDDDNNEHSGREDDNDEDNEDGRDDDDADADVHEDHEKNDGEDDEVDNMHLSRRSSPVCSEDDNNENNDVDKEGEGEAGSYSNSKDDEDEDEDDDGEDNEDNNLHEVLQSSHGIAPVYSVGDDDKNNDVNEEGDSDEDRTRTRKRKRGTMKKPKRSKVTVMATTMMNTMMGAATTVRTMTATRKTMRRRFCIHLAGIHKFIPWTTMKRRRKARGEGESMATTRKRTRSMMKKPKKR